MFFQAKQLQEYKNKVVTAFETQRKRMAKDHWQCITTYLRGIVTRKLADINVFRLCATQRKKLLTRLTDKNLANSIISIQTFENEGMSGDCLVGILDDWALSKTNPGFYLAFCCAVTGLPLP